LQGTGRRRGVPFPFLCIRADPAQCGGRTHREDDIQYALETTRVLYEPDRRIDTFSSTRFEFRLLSELMDTAGQVRIRTGEVEASKPVLMRPDEYRDIELDGFGEEMRGRFDEMLEHLRDQGLDLAFLKYGFLFRRGEVQEEIVHDSFDAVVERVVEEAKHAGNPMEAVIAGVDDAWEISILKFAFHMISRSQDINRFDFKRKGLL